jgi:hypothetical protein
MGVYTELIGGVGAPTGMIGLVRVNISYEVIFYSVSVLLT